MKIFNDQKQFKKVLELFDMYKKNPSVDSSSMIINEALKACTHLSDLRRGMDIHRLFSSQIKDDPYIGTSLIHFYSQSYTEKKRH